MKMCRKRQKNSSRHEIQSPTVVFRNRRRLRRTALDRTRGNEMQIRPDQTYIKTCKLWWDIRISEHGAFAERDLKDLAEGSLDVVYATPSTRGGDEGSRSSWNPNLHIHGLMLLPLDKSHGNRLNANKVQTEVGCTAPPLQKGHWVGIVTPFHIFNSRRPVTVRLKSHLEWSRRQRVSLPAERDLVPVELRYADKAMN